MKPSIMTIVTALTLLIASAPNQASAAQFLDCDNLMLKTKHFSGACNGRDHNPTDFENCLTKRCLVHNEAIKRLNPNGIACPGPDDRGRVRKWLDKNKLGCPKDVY